MPTGRPPLTEYPRNRSSLKIETDVPTCAAAGDAKGRAAANRMDWIVADRRTLPVAAREARGAAGTVTGARYLRQCRAGVDRSATAPIGDEEERGGMPALPSQSDQPADMRCGKRAAIDEKPSSSGHCRGYILTGRSVNIAARRCQ